MLEIKNTEWNLKHLLDDESKIEEHKQELKQAYDDFVKKWKHRDDYLKNPGILKEALDDYNKLLNDHNEGGKPMFYYYLRKTVEQGNNEVEAKYSQTLDFVKKLENEANFFLLNIAKINSNEQEKFLEHKGLQGYKHRMERLFKQAKHFLSQEEERILNLKSKAGHIDWTSMTSKFLAREDAIVADEDGNKKSKSFSELIGLVSNKNKKIRDEAAMGLNGIINKTVDVAEHEVNAILGNKKIDDELRKMDRPDLDRHLNDDMDSKIVDALVKAVAKRFDISERYYKLKASLLGLKKLEYHERNVGYGSLEKEYNYEESLNLVYDVFNKLDKNFADIVKRFNENGQVDVYPRKGKRNGAYCAYWTINHPSYIMLNHNNKINDVLIIAHEFGHAINDELIRKKQNAFNFGTPTSTAEVASTFMEGFVVEELMNKADDEERLALMMLTIGEDINKIQRQIAGYMFEQELHKAYRERGYLSKDEIGKLFQKHMSAYMGEYVEQSPGSENWWVYWHHIRMFFYVYSYSSGILIAKALQDAVRKDKKFINKVKEFLSTGLSDSPKNIFLKMGIDIADEGFWNKGLDNMEEDLKKAEMLAKKLGRI